MKQTTKLYLFILLFLIGSNLHAQNVADTTSKIEFKTEEIKFKSDTTTLAAKIFMPKNPLTAVVLVHGSGQEKRLTRLATHLASNGIAVLTYDKRGVGESGGVYVGPEVGTNNIDTGNLNLLALDASEASNTLLKYLPAKGIEIGLIGFSQAGWVIPLAASKNPKLNFIILFSGPVVTTLEQLRFQFYTQGNVAFWETHTEADVRLHIKTDLDRYQFAPTYPANALAKLNVHGLWFFGGKDIQIPVGLSVERLNLLKTAGKNYEYQIFPDLGHNTASIKSPQTMSFAIKWMKRLAEK